MIETISLSPGDAVSAVLAKLRGRHSERVLLVIPPGLSLSSVELRLVRRYASELGLQIALQSSSGGLRMLAAQEGISTFRSRRWAMHAPWRRIRPDPATRRPPLGSARVEAPFGAGLYSPRSPTGFKPNAFLRSFVVGASPWWASLGLALLLLAMSAGLLYVLTLVIPAASVIVTPSAEALQVAVPLAAIQDAVVDNEAGVVPARVLSAQVSGEGRAPTTGRRYEPATKAVGKVIVMNRTSRAVSVPVGTVVSTETGNNVRFATTAEALLAPNGRASVPVEAALAGPDGNVRAGTVSQVEGSLALSVVVANDSAFSGGTMAQVGVVTEEDQERLQAKLFDDLKSKALEQLNGRLEPRSFVPADSVTYMALSPTFTPFVGEVSPDLNLSMSVQAVGLVVDGVAAERLALTRLREAMPPESRLISDTVRFIPGAVQVQDARTVNFTIIAEGSLLRGVDTRAVRTAALSQTPERAAALLEERFALSQPPRIHLGPDWLPYLEPTKMPAVPWRISVAVDWDGAAAQASRKP